MKLVNSEVVIQLQEACNRAKANLRKFRAELDRLPSGPLYAYKRKNKFYFSTMKKGSHVGISKDREVLHELARRQYLTLRCGEIEKELSWANKALEHFAASGKTADPLHELPSAHLIEKYANMGLDISQIVYSQEQRQWMLKAASQNQYKAEELRYETYSGVLVRSKSEQAIGNMLETMGIPYRYESPLTIDLAMKRGMPPEEYPDRIFYPDFTILLADGSLLYWEHLGRVDLPDYRMHNMDKIIAYRQRLGIPESRLILTFESDMQRPQDLEDIIRRRVILAGV